MSYDDFEPERVIYDIGGSWDQYYKTDYAVTQLL